MQYDTEEGDEYEDFVEELPSGVQDIIITGEVGFLPFSASSSCSFHQFLVQTCERQGEAWGYHSYIGRIRPWDGFVVLLRIPVRNVSGSLSQTSRPHSHLITEQMNNQYRDTGRWIFKGYVYERSLVGRWRDTATDEHAVGFEGGFVLCKEDEVNTASMFA